MSTAVVTCRAQGRTFPRRASTTGGSPTSKTIGPTPASGTGSANTSTCRLRRRRTARSQGPPPRQRTSAMPTSLSPPRSSDRPGYARLVANLAERIVARIRTRGPITFADYMETALFDPEDGYYTTRASLGFEGDYVT